MLVATIHNYNTYLKYHIKYALMQVSKFFKESVRKRKETKMKVFNTILRFLIDEHWTDVYFLLTRIRFS